MDCSTEIYKRTMKKFLKIKFKESCAKSRNQTLFELCKKTGKISQQ